MVDIKKIKELDDELDNLRSSMQKVMSIMFSEISSIKNGLINGFKEKYLTNDSEFPTLVEMEKWLITEALKKNNWNKTKVAVLLDISERTVRRRMNEYGLKENE